MNADSTDAARLRSLIHNSFDLMTISDAEGNLLYLTPSAERILGYVPDEVLGQNILSFVHPDDVERVAAAFAHALNTPGTLAATVLRARHRDGSWRVLEAASNNLLDDPSVGGIVHNMHDITARYEAEAAVRRSEQKLRAYVDKATDLIWTIDAQGRMTSVNDRVCETLGYTAEELVGRPALDLVVPGQAPALAAFLADIVQGGTIDQAEAEVLTKSGGRIWLEIRGRSFRDGDTLIEIFQIARDITDRKRAEEALRASEALYRSILNSSPDAVAITDMEARIRMYSPVALTIFGFESSEDLAGRLITEFIVPEDRELAFANISRMAARSADRSQRSPDEYRAVRADGSVFPVEVMGEFVRDATGQPTGMVFDLRDITERKEAEAERDRLEARLVQSQKLEAVGQLAGGVAHDFNNMLGVILTSAELAMMSLDASSPARADIAEIRNAAERSAALTRQLLAFARRQVIAPKRLDLNDTAARTLYMLERLIGEDTHLVWSPSAEPCPVYMDPGQVDQILANLVVNARDAIASGGTVTVATALAELGETPGAPASSTSLPGRYVVLSVTDDGCGMNEETRTRIFEPFFTTKPIGQGTGLGLATVYGIAQQNRGFVEADSAPGIGTTVRVYLPRWEVLAQDTDRSAVAAVSPSGTETILLVEDEIPLLRLVTRMLEGLGYSVLASGSPVEALEVAAGHTGKIDLLVSDLVMPGMNGIELRKQLSAIRPALKCLFVSGYPATVLAENGMAAEHVDLLEKPFTREALAARVRDVLARA